MADGLIPVNVPFPHVTTTGNSTSPRVLVGGAGAPNYGDELIVKGWMDLLEKTGPADGQIIFYENTSRRSREFHLPEGHSMAHRVTFRDDLTLIAKAVPGLTFWEQVERGFTFMRDFGFSKHGYKGSRELFEASSFLLHGGGYLNDIRSDKAFLLGFVASLKKTYGIPAYATGIGFGPFKKECSDPARFAEIMSHFEIFETRDAEGYELLTRLAPSANIIDGIDDCFVLPAEKMFRRDSSRRRLHVSLIASHLIFLTPRFWDWLGEQAEAFEEVCFWESYPWNDREVIARLAEAVPSCKVITTRELVHEHAPVGEEDVFLTHRFHVHFAAARAGARGYYMAPSLYYRQKHQSIVDLGSGLLPLDLAILPDLSNLPPSLPLDEAGLSARKMAIVETVNGRAPVPTLAP